MPPEKFSFPTFAFNRFVVIIDEIQSNSSNIKLK